MTVLLAAQATGPHPPGTDPPLTWRLVTIGGGGRSATLVCGNGHDGGLLDHTITADGLVSPSVVCNGIPAHGDQPAVGCTWHEYVRLDGWASG